MPSSKELTEDLIEELGGCGRYQIVSTITILLSEAIMVWSMTIMVFNGKTPAFHCLDGHSLDDVTHYNVNVDANSANVTYHSVEANGSYTALKACRTRDDRQCTGHQFEDDIHTTVDEWGLVCDLKWVVAAITTVQMSGVLIGALILGQVADAIGRKHVYFGSILTLVVLNVVASFSVNWEMYMVIAFFIGSACSGVLVTRYIIMLEFMPSLWRPRVLSIPAWSFLGSMQAMCVLAVKNWKHLHLATAAVGTPFLLTYWSIQESSRWQLTKDRFVDAERSINRVAKINGHAKPNLHRLFTKVKEERNASNNEHLKSYTMLDLFRTTNRAKTTLVLCFIWFAASYSWYGLTFGVGRLVGNLYVNMMLNNALDLPLIAVVVIAMNRLGRRYSCALFFTIMGLCGIVSGSFEYIEVPGRRTVVRVSCLMAKMAISAAWTSVSIFTNELYPTVVRSLACGVVNVAAEVGAMLAPQTVFLGDEIPGLLYFPNAALSLISGLLCLTFVETRGELLNDRFGIEKTGKGTARDGEIDVQPDDRFVKEKSENGTAIDNETKVRQNYQGGKMKYMCKSPTPDI